MAVSATTIPDTTTAAGGDTSGSNLGGDGLPVQHPGEDYGNPSGPLTAVFVLEGNGCWSADRGDGPHVVIFPAGFTKPAENGLIMEGPDGTVVETGTAYQGLGGEVAADGLPGGPDSFLGNYLTFCNPDRSTVLVFDSLAVAARAGD